MASFAEFNGQQYACTVIETPSTVINVPMPHGASTWQNKTTQQDAILYFEEDTPDAGQFQLWHRQRWYRAQRISSVGGNISVRWL